MPHRPLRALLSTPQVVKTLLPGHTSFGVSSGHPMQEDSGYSRPKGRDSRGSSFSPTPPNTW